MHKHNFKVMDIVDSDPGLVYVECIDEDAQKRGYWGHCSMRGKMAVDKETAELYNVEYFPEAAESYFDIVMGDLKALNEAKTP